MNERMLGSMLLELDATDLGQAPDSRQYTTRILNRDRRRVRWLTVGAVGLWTFATVLILLVLVILGLLFPMKAKLQQPHEVARLTAAEFAQAKQDVEIGMNMMIVLTAFSGAVSSAAVLCTLLLVLSSRRATLRQVNANLLEICEQLRRLQNPRSENQGGTSRPA